MQQPNILFILIDDLGWRDLSCYGSSFYETPVLDRLAQQGLLFTNAYASCPVCSPTRASILSGKYPARLGMTQWIGGRSHGRLQDVPYLHYLPHTEISLATTLREAGYQTWHVGKWHLGDSAFYPQTHGFDINIGGNHHGHPANGYFAPWGLENMPEEGQGRYLTDALTEHALRLIQRRERRPFFLHLSHYAVHTPIQAPADLVRKYEEKARALGLDRQKALVEGEKFGCAHKMNEHIRRRVVQSDPAYAAMIENLDWNIGRVLDCLRAEGIERETLVVFTADNGGLSSAEGSPTCNLPLREGKGWSYEGGTRVCQIIRWPGVVAPGGRCAEAVTSTDFYPTLLEAAGLPLMPQQHRDGVSLSPLLRGETGLARDAIFWHYPHYSNQGGRPAASLVSGRWKLLRHFEDGVHELFDLHEDPGELRDVAAANPPVVRRLAGLLADWIEDVGAIIPLPDPDCPAALLRPRIANNAHI